VFQHSFLDFFLHFLPDPYGIRSFQLNVRRYDHLIFVIFIGILLDFQDFTVEMKAGGRRTVSYADTVLQAHVQAKASAAT